MLGAPVTNDGDRSVRVLTGEVADRRLIFLPVVGVAGGWRVSVVAFADLVTRFVTSTSFSFIGSVASTLSCTTSSVTTLSVVASFCGCFSVEVVNDESCGIVEDT